MKLHMLLLFGALFAIPRAAPAETAPPPAIALIEITTTHFWANRAGQPFESRMRLHRDGRATYEGFRQDNVFHDDVARGRHVAREFERLVQTFERLDLGAAAGFHRGPGTCGTTTTITIRDADEDLVLFASSYAGAGPDALWAARRLLVGAAHSIGWTPAAPPAPVPPPPADDEPAGR